MSSLPNYYDDWKRRARNASRASHEILARYGHAQSRVITIRDLLVKLDSVSIDIASYFKEAVGCLEQNFLRAAIVFAWAGFFRVFAEYVYANKEGDLRKIRHKWSFKDVQELLETQSESQIIDVAKELKVVSRGDTRIFQGRLAQRNKCAHPSLYQPSQNEAIGYVDQVISDALKYV